MNTIKKILAPLASLRVTVVLLAVAMVLIFAGTLAQRTQGIWQVKQEYFSSVWVKVPIQNMLPFVSTEVPGWFPFVGGYALIIALLVNLLAAHTVRFKMSWKRSGVLLTHFGLILLLVGEIVTTEMAVESQMTIEEGQTVRWSQDIREYELAIVDHSPSDKDEVVVVPESMLVAGNVVRDPRLPFDVKVERYHPNSELFGPMQPGGDGETLANAGHSSNVKVAGRPRVTGTQGNEVDAASGFFTLRKDGQELGTYLVSLFLTQPQKVEVGGKTYEVSLRFKRIYHPYAITLHDFTHDRYTGTEMARNFASRVRLADPTTGEDREVTIRMNSPLRYGGETFFQSGFRPGDTTTILLIVRNPGWLVPYIAVVIGGVGLILHFTIHLVGFLRRRSAAIGAPLAAPAGPPGRSTSGGRATAAAGQYTGYGSRYTLQPSHGPGAWLVPVVVGLLCLGYAVPHAMDRKISDKWDLNGFGKVPINYEGRVMPLDSLARNTLKIVSTRESLKIRESDYKDPQRVKAIEWLTEVLASTDRANKLEVFRVDNDEVRSVLELPDHRSLPGGKKEDRKYYSFDELWSKRDKLQEQYQRIREVPKEKRSAYQKRMAETVEHLMMYGKIVQLGGLYVVPPMEQGKDWRTLGEVAQASRQSGQRDPAAVAFLNMIQAYHEDKPAEFNKAVAEYHQMLAQSPAKPAGKASFEAFYNRFDAFTVSMVFYVAAFVVVAFAWLGWTRPLARGAVTLVVAAFVVETIGLAARMYITGRPPVTNLYSSALFIGWGAVALCLVLERMYRNTLGTAVGAIIGFATLLIAGGIAASDAGRGQADTMAQLQAVLDTNFWLATHVVAITIGYLAVYVAGLLGIVYILLGLGSMASPNLFTPGTEVDVRKTLVRMVYGVTAFGLIFSFVGTILGGIWADQSWGRFWGWDPKENGAILIVLWVAIILHARWGGVVRERGIMVLAIFGNIVTTWSWFGTNMLGVGLHAYGFMDQALFWMKVAVISHLLIMAAGALPIWRTLSGEEERSSAGRKLAAKR